jgi:hypothetical protein
MKKLVLSIRFTTNDENREAFKEILTDLFEVISEEDSFESASIVEAVENPDILMVYETWNITLPKFMAQQMTRLYRLPFEKALIDLNVKREPGVFQTIKEWHADQHNQYVFGRTG